MEFESEIRQPDTNGVNSFQSIDEHLNEIEKRTNELNDIIKFYDEKILRIRSLQIQIDFQLKELHDLDERLLENRHSIERNRR